MSYTNEELKKIIETQKKVIEMLEKNKLETPQIVERVKKAQDENDSRAFNKEFDKLVPKRNHKDGSQTIDLGDILDTMTRYEIIDEGD